MAKKSKKTAKTVKAAKVAKSVKSAKPPAAASRRAATSRRLKRPQYKSFRLHKRIKHPAKLPGVWRLSKMAVKTIWRHKKLLVGIILVYGLLNLLLVQGLTAGPIGDVRELKSTLDQTFSGHLSSLSSSLSIFTVLLGSAGNASDGTAAAYQFGLGLITSLAVIWALRQVLSGSAARLRIRDAYYRSSYPLVPFILVLVVIGLQLIPWLIGSTLYSLVINNGIAVYAVEKVLWAILFGLLTLLSLYMISSSLFALYIVTLPDMTPMKALRSARELVRHRRWTVLRKVASLPILLLLAAAVIMLPIIIWLPAAAEWVFWLLTMMALLAGHSYMYTLYRELLND